MVPRAKGRPEGLRDVTDPAGDEAQLWSAYETMFGAEALRSAALGRHLGNGVLDDRTVQLFLFGRLLTSRPDAAAGHAAAARRGPGHMGEAHIPLDEDIQPPRTGRVGHGGDRTIGTRGWPPYVNPATEIAWRRAWYGG